MTAGSSASASTTATVTATTTTTAATKRGNGKNSSSSTSVNDASMAVGEGRGNRVVLTTAPFKHLKSPLSVSTPYSNENNNYEATMTNGDNAGGNNGGNNGGSSGDNNEGNNEGNNGVGNADTLYHMTPKAVAARSSQCCPFHPQLVVAGGYR